MGARGQPGPEGERRARMHRASGANRRGHCQKWPQGATAATVSRQRSRAQLL